MADTARRPVARFLRAASALAVVGGLVACGGQPAGSPAADPNEERAAVVSTLDHREMARFQDPQVGLSGRYPQAWHRARALTSLVSPREVLALASYPMRDPARAGECAPDTARRDMSPGGVFLWMLEYRPVRGDVWADLPRERFPPKPVRFTLDPGDLGGDDSCFVGPTYRTSFRAADRPFQLLVAFGGQPSDQRLKEVEQVLASLSFDELPPPPPDPYAGWPLINDNPGDSLRPPPDWPAAAAMFRPDLAPRPRVLFFASNRPLPGLPQKLVPHVDELPGPMPDAALASFPPDGVLVWVVEEDKGALSAAFPATGTGWPAGADFRETEAPTSEREVRWRRAGGSFRGYRFAVWVGAGSSASETDVELAFKSAASLAVSGCWRDRFDDCADP